MRAVARGAGVLILVLAGIAVVMAKTQRFDPPPAVPSQVRSPILALELARSAADLRGLFGDPAGERNREVFRGQIAQDWAFIAAYWAMFAALAAILRRREGSRSGPLALGLLIAATAAALCDAFENAGILLAVDTESGKLTNALARTIRGASLAKWGLLAVAEGLAAPLFLRYAGGGIVTVALSRIAGWLCAGAAILGLAGLAWNPAIGWSTALFAAGLAAACPLLLLTPGRFLDGVGGERTPGRRWPWRSLLVVSGTAAAGLAAILLVRTATLNGNEDEPPRAEPIDVDADAAAARLLGAVHIETISHADTGEADRAKFVALHAYLKATFPVAHDRLRWEDVDGSLLLTWEGSEPKLDPLVLLGHMDVVPAVPEGPDAPTVADASWASRAFGSKLEETRPFVVGRGTLDDKVAVVGLLEAVETLIRDGFRPRRTVLLAFGRDEEVGGKLGAARLVALLADRKVRPACVLDEGSYVLEGVLSGVAAPVAPIGVGEKGYADIELSVAAEGGHSSIPPRHTAIGILAAAIARLEARPMPARLAGLPEKTFRALAPEFPFAQRLVIANTWLLGGVLEWGLSRSPTTDALIRTTSAATIVRGGTKDNVLPASADAIVNVRLMPGDSVQAVLEHVRSAVGDPRVSVRLADPTRHSSPSEASGVAPSDSNAFRAIRDAIRQTFPGSRVAPYLVTGGTDARRYEVLTPFVYRFLPVRLHADDLKRIHGVDERIAVTDYADAVRFYARLIRGFDSDPAPNSASN